MKLLNDLLLYLSEHCLIDTIGFGLKNKNDKTPFEIAVQNENSEAIFLLNHYEFYDNKSTNKYDYESIDLLNTFNLIIKINNIKTEIKQDNRRIRNLVFQNGSSRLTYLIALKDAIKEKRFKLEEIDKIAGSSMSAIIATLLGIGYKLNDLEKELKSLDKLSGFHLDDIKFFQKWTNEKITVKLRVNNATFKDLQEKIKVKGTTYNFKYLFLTALNFQTGKCEIFSHLHTPNMIISDAVRRSISMPFLFHPNESLFDSTIIDKNIKTTYINKETLVLFVALNHEMNSDHFKLNINLDFNKKETAISELKFKSSALDWTKLFENLSEISMKKDLMDRIIQLMGHSNSSFNIIDAEAVVPEYQNLNTNIMCQEENESLEAKVGQFTVEIVPEDQNLNYLNINKEKFIEAKLDKVIHAEKNTDLGDVANLL